MRVEYRTTGAFQSFYADRKGFEKKLSAKKEQNKTFDKKQKSIVAVAACAGAILPVVLLNIKKGRGKVLKDTIKNSTSTLKDKMKAIYNIFEIENFPEILASTTGAIALGTLGGVAQTKDKNEKEAKYKEGIFEFLNNMTPTCLVAASEHYSRKTGKFTSKKARALTIAASVVGGMFIANKTSNKINNKIFDKDENKQNKRGFKITDCLVHLDDILGLLVIAKVPLAKKIQADKILPLLYSKSGYEAGAAQDDNFCDRI